MHLATPCRLRRYGRTHFAAGHPRLPPFAAILIALVLTLVPRHLLAAETAAAERLVAETAAAMVEVARAVKAGKGGQEAAFRRVLARSFDAAELAMASLPRPAPEGADAALLARYRSAFVVYLTKAFLEEAVRSPLYETKVVGSRVHASGRFIVHSVGETSNGARREADWFVTACSAPKIVDAAVRGILLSANERKRFAPVLVRGGLSALVVALERGPAGFEAALGEDVWR